MYKVHWQVLSVDTHTTEGTFSFPGREIGGDAASRRDAGRPLCTGRQSSAHGLDPGRTLLINPLIIVRDIHFASSVILAGIAFFDWLIASLVLRRHFRTQAAERCFS